MDALPEIVAVVRTAEELIDPIMQPGVERAVLLDQALADLDVKLGEP